VGLMLGMGQHEYAEWIRAIHAHDHTWRLTECPLDTSTSNVIDPLSASPHLPQPIGATDAPSGVGGLSKRDAEQRAAIVTAIREAESLDEEIAALLAGLSERDTHFLYAAWGLRDQNMTQAAEHWGVSRERARQVIQRRENLLDRIKPRLPIAERVVAAVEAAGGLVWHGHIERLLTDEGITASELGLGALSAMAPLHLVSMFGFHKGTRSWYTQRGHSEWLGDRELGKKVRLFKRLALRELSHLGAVRMSTIDSFPLPGGREQALEALRGLECHWAEGGGFVVPQHPVRSRLFHLTSQMLLVTPELSLGSLRRGARRPSQKPVDLDEDSLKAILELDPRLVVSHGRVRLRSLESAESALNNIHAAIVRAAQQNDGIVTHEAIERIVRLCGAPRGMTVHYCRSPFLRRVRYGTYELRGWAVSQRRGDSRAVPEVH
jgi:hypothetical protein